MMSNALLRSHISHLDHAEEPFYNEGCGSIVWTLHGMCLSDRDFVEPIMTVGLEARIFAHRHADVPLVLTVPDTQTHLKRQGP